MTTLSDAKTGETKNVIEWRTPEGEGEWGDYLGGEWLTDDIFLTYQTLDEGPLLVTVGQAPTRVASELFGQQDQLDCQPTGCEKLWRADGARVGDAYHLVLSGTGTSPYPAALLYHSESGAVEQLPFDPAWGSFSPDGRWLLMDERPTVKGYEQYTVHFRPVDPIDSEPRFLAGSPSLYPLWSPDWTRVAVNAPSGRLNLFSFPDGGRLGSWQGERYEVIPWVWSPDQRWLAVHGYVPGTYSEALFVIPVAP